MSELSYSVECRNVMNAAMLGVLVIITVALEMMFKTCMGTSHQSVGQIGVCFLPQSDIR